MQAARGLKRASSRLQVGGPAGCFGSWGNSRADCLHTFIDYCRSNASGLVPTNIKLNGSVPLDFVSTHVYAGGASNVNNADTIVNHLSAMKPVATKAGLYHIMTEWGGSYLNGAGTGSGVGHAVGGTANFDYHTPPSWRGAQQDTYETASFILQTILKTHQANLTFNEREATSYWDVSDVFEEGGFAFANNSFNGNFGLVNIHGIPKPAYRAFQLLHELGDELLSTTISSEEGSIESDGGGGAPPEANCSATLGVLASICNASVLSVLLFSQATLGTPISPSCTATVNISTDGSGIDTRSAAGMSAATVVQGSVRRIDAIHTAPKAAWLAMGMPQWPTTDQNAKIFEASIMQKKKLPISKHSKLLSFEVEIPANAVVAVQVPIGSGDEDVIEAQRQHELREQLSAARARLLAAEAEVASLRAQLQPVHGTVAPSIKSDDFTATALVETASPHCGYNPTPRAATATDTGSASSAFRIVLAVVPIKTDDDVAMAITNPDSGTAAFEVDLSLDKRQVWSRFYSEGVSAGHIGLAARADYRTHLAMVAKSCGFKYVRGHGLLDDDVAVSFAPGVSSWLNIFSLVDYELGLGMLPFFEVSYVPSWLSSDNCTKQVMGYRGCCAPPASYERWSTLLQELGEALIDRYGLEQASKFRFEVWNELDCLNSTEYHEIYAATARGLKRASEKLLVGGPATSCGNGWDEPSHPQQGRLFLEFCRNHSVPIDFFSSHVYANKKWTGWVGRASAVVQGVQNATSLMDEFGDIMDGKPYYNTEFGTTDLQGDGSKTALTADIHDTHEQASFLVAVVDALVARSSPGSPTFDPTFRLPSTLSYWTFSDIMNEQSASTDYAEAAQAPAWSSNSSFHGGFGLVNAFGVPKPSFRAYELLHQMHSWSLPVSQTTATSTCNRTTGALATTNGSDVMLLLYNHAEWDAPQLDHRISSVPCVLTVVFSDSGLADSVVANIATIRVVDAGHANPRAKWIELGMPAYPSEAEHEQIMAASEMVSQIVPLVTQPDGRSMLRVTLERHSIVAVNVGVSFKSDDHPNDPIQAVHSKSAALRRQLLTAWTFEPDASASPGYYSSFAAAPIQHIIAAMYLNENASAVALAQTALANPNMSQHFAAVYEWTCVARAVSLSGQLSVWLVG
eukprot:SAG22_NODE_58_length_23645_cov_16.637943_13_plen_1140_part_00